MKVKTRVKAEEYSKPVFCQCTMRADLVTHVFVLDYDKGLIQAEYADGSRFVIKDAKGSIYRDLEKWIERHEELTELEIDKHIADNKLEKARRNGTA